jgi:hypothetical protein
VVCHAAVRQAHTALATLQSVVPAAFWASSAQQHVGRGGTPVVLLHGGLPGSIPGSPVPHGARATTTPASTTLHHRTSMTSPGGRRTVRARRPATGHGSRPGIQAPPARLRRTHTSTLYVSTGYAILYVGIAGRASGCATSTQQHRRSSASPQQR